jgi:transposase-like protein
MNLSSLPLSQLRHILSLVERKEAVKTEISEVEAEIAILESQKAQIEARMKAQGWVKIDPKVKGKTAPKAGRKVVSESKGKPAARTGRKGGTKEKILAVLKKAGARGVSVSDIAQTLGVTAGSVHVWFSTAGKDVNGLRKVSPGVYVLR